MSDPNKLSAEEQAAAEAAAAKKAAEEAAAKKQAKAEKDPADETPAWQSRDYDGALTGDQAAWRNAHLKPVEKARTK